MRSALVCLVALILASTSFAGEIKQEQLYLGQKPPGLEAEIFAPHLFADDESAGCSGFLDDGKVFVFDTGKKGGDWRFGPTLVTRFTDGRGGRQLPHRLPDRS